MLGQSLQKNIDSCKIEEEIICRDSPCKKILILAKLRKKLFIGTVPENKTKNEEEIICLDSP